MVGRSACMEKPAYIHLSAMYGVMVEFLIKPVIIASLGSRLARAHPFTYWVLKSLTAF